MLRTGLSGPVRSFRGGTTADRSDLDPSARNVEGRRTLSAVAETPHLVPGIRRRAGKPYCIACHGDVQRQGDEWTHRTASLQAPPLPVSDGESPRMLAPHWPKDVYRTPTNETRCGLCNLPAEQRGVTWRHVSGARKALEESNARAQEREVMERSARRRFYDRLIFYTNPISGLLFAGIAGSIRVEWTVPAYGAVLIVWGGLLVWRWQLRRTGEW